MNIMIKAKRLIEILQSFITPIKKEIKGVSGGLISKHAHADDIVLFLLNAYQQFETVACK